MESLRETVRVPAREKTSEDEQEQPLNFSRSHAAPSGDEKDEETRLEGVLRNGGLRGNTLLTYPPSIFVPSGLVPSSYMSSLAAAAAMSAAMNAAVAHGHIRPTM
ncbi:unnamed protein product [Toxocara canis]|uniref:Dachshund homolog 1-like n=1 Tax=Toxocara canis TaxID=6265 RepID=A0A183V8U0_TOXCA|nr:unnamed protein product [Toxocara canis]